MRRMKRWSWMLYALAAVWVGAGARVAAGQGLYKSREGPYAVGEREAVWRDEARKRDVPVKVYVPRRVETENKEGGRDARPTENPKEEKFPVIVFSHGMGASREMYAYFGEHMASWGYLVIHPQHAGSDTPAVKEEIRERLRDPGKKEREKESGNSDDVEERFRGGLIVENTSDPENLRNRPLDVSFVLDRVEKDPELSRLADMGRVAVAGHSFGSYTAMAVAGMTVELPKEGALGGPPLRGGETPDPPRSVGPPKAAKVERVPTRLADPRVKAAIAMSPQGAGMMSVREHAWETIHIPVLMLTGTRDMGVGGKAEEFRRQAFDDVRGIDAYLVTLEGATHMTFGGKAGVLGRGKEEKYVSEIDAACTAFCDAYLRGDEKAMEWLKKEMPGVVEGKVEEKSGGPQSSK